MLDIPVQNLFLPHQDDDQTPRIAITDTGGIAYASPSFCDLMGVEADQFHALNLKTIFGLSDTDDAFMSRLKTGEHTIHHENHKYTFAFEWMGIPDQKRYFIGSFVKEQKKTPQNAINHYDFEIFVGLSQDIMVVFDMGDRFLRGNDNFSLFFSENDIVLSDMPDIFETDIDGRFIQWRKQAHDDEQFLVGRDITDIKTQRKALEDHEKKLSEAESIGRMGHWHWRIGDDEVEWSGAIYKMFGVDQSFKPTLQSINAMVHKRDIPRANQAFQRAIIENNDYDLEFRVLRPDGSVRFIRCEGRCQLDEDGDVVALYGIMQDMTERILHEQQLREAKDAAERAYATKSQFLTNMSHELRTPLNAIIGFSEIMQQELLGPIGTEKYREYINGIHQSGGHLLDLISDILDMSKIEAGKYDLSLESVNVYKTVRMALHMAEGRAKDGGLIINTDPQPREDLSIVADRRAVMQILLNVLSNAVKFTPQGGRVTLSCHERDNYIAFKIKDTGIGIPANKLATITKPFEQVSHSYARDHEGSGLGLAITKELVEMHGGNLFIESQMGIGTTVTIRLPYDAFVATDVGAG